MRVRQLLVFFAFMVVSLRGADVAPSKWASSHHPITLAVHAPLEVFAQQIDREDRVRVLLIDQQDGTSIHLRVDEKHALLVLREDAYRKTLRDGLSGGRILDERDVQLFSAEWHRIRGELMNEKWKARMIVDIHYRLVGEKLALIQWAFPCEEPSADSSLPSKIQMVVDQSTVFSGK